MADTGWVIAGSGQNIFGIGPDWNNPTRVNTDDGSYSSVVCGVGIVSDLLKADQFGFAIPAGATIDGIEVEIVDYKGVAGGA